MLVRSHSKLDSGVRQEKGEARDSGQKVMSGKCSWELLRAGGRVMLLYAAHVICLSMSE